MTSPPNGSKRSPKVANFAHDLLVWYDRHGRKALPWKRPRDPYRIWIAEVMLQQTQVSTVIPYFERFMHRFPDIARLARGPLDRVLGSWSGLGYYARARNLHRAARAIVQEHGGRFPRTFEAVAALPGIGRSTAGAILSQAFGQRHPILDGNVKRVLSRYYAIHATGTAANTELWRLAEMHTPTARVSDYTQAIMDLGATVCARVRPQCAQCPVSLHCVAQREGKPERYPVRSATRARPRKRARWLMIRDHEGRVLLERRPPAGVWGGLWSFPECPVRSPEAFARERFGLDVAPRASWPPFSHGFTHFELVITPVPATVVGNKRARMERGGTLWVKLASPKGRGPAGAIGLPAPVRTLLEKLRNDSWQEW